uniref:Uncharacterized protein n=1 Tax=Arundo donax TaxID=35708 RepID=A0A0A9ARN7_ARUDO
MQHDVICKPSSVAVSNTRPIFLLLFISSTLARSLIRHMTASPHAAYRGSIMRTRGMSSPAGEVPGVAGRRR